MKLLAAGIVLVLAASTAEAFPFFHKSSSTDKLPKPIDTPIVRPKTREDHKAGKRAGRHPQDLQHSEYGNEWDRTLKGRPHPVPPYITRND